MILRVLSILVLLAWSAHALEVGDKAPSLKGVKSWYNGEGVDPGEEGQITIVDFWATWCAPCRNSIPHLNDLYAKYKSEDLVIAGITLEGKSKVEPFLKLIPMNFPVGMDTRGTTKKTYTAGRDTIPQAFLVDRKGIVVWEGHPLDGLDEVLSEVIAGTWTIEKALSFAEMIKQKEQLQEMLSASLRAKDTEAALRILDKLAKVDPNPAPVVLFRAQLLMREGRAEEAQQAFRDIVRESNDAPEVLGEIAWNVLQFPRKHRDLKVAIDAAERAVELTDRKKPEHLETLALCLYYLGDLDAASIVQQEAVDIAGERSRAGFEDSLRYYQAAQALRSERSKL
jgi:thiol-disulfide isomerase/thioredoxin